MATKHDIGLPSWSLQESSYIENRITNCRARTKRADARNNLLLAAVESNSIRMTWCNYARLGIRHCPSDAMQKTLDTPMRRGVVRSNQKHPKCSILKYRHFSY